jgi:hypothetical protein
VGRPAGIYWLEGRSVIATHGTRAEEHLLELGAVLVATLCFNGDALERSHRGRPVDRLAPWQLIEPDTCSPGLSRRPPNSYGRPVAD